MTWRSRGRGGEVVPLTCQDKATFSPSMHPLQMSFCLCQGSSDYSYRGDTQAGAPGTLLFQGHFPGMPIKRCVSCGSQGGHLWDSWEREGEREGKRERKKQRASASGSDHSWHGSPASSQVGAGQWSGANGHLPSLSIELIVLSRGTEHLVK